MERDVAADPLAAREMMRRSRQQGVPVIVADDEVIVGFDRQRLERIAARHAAAARSEAGRPKLGLVVKDAAGGVEVGGVRPGSPAEQAGFRPGDIVLQVRGQPVGSVADLERLTGTLGAGQTAEVVVRREGRPERLWIAT